MPENKEGRCRRRMTRLVLVLPNHQTTMNVIIDGIEYVPKGEIPPITDESLKECLRHLVNIQYFTDDRHKHRSWGWDALNALAPELAKLPPKEAWDRIYDENVEVDRGEVKAGIQQSGLSPSISPSCSLL